MRRLILLALALASLAAPARAENVARLICAKADLEWNRVAGGADVAAMDRVIRSIPAFCPVLKARADRQRTEAAGGATADADAAGPTQATTGATAYRAARFVVYFPAERFVLPQDAQNVIAQAARYALAGHARRVYVVGHTDTLGTYPSQVRMSERRAKEAAELLTNLGVDTDILDVSWKGATAMAVRTSDGVSEPLNRRVEIDVRF